MILAAAESDIAQALVGLKNKAIAQASETDTAQPISIIYQFAILQALEADSAFGLGKLKNKSIAQAIETDTALAINPATLGVLIEESSCRVRVYFHQELRARAVPYQELRVRAVPHHDIGQIGQAA